MLHVTDDLTILARLVNGIALSQGLTDGSVKVSSIVRELLHLGPKITLDTLISDQVSELHTDLSAVATALNGECGGQRGCGNVGSIAEGLKILENIAPVVGEMERVLANTSSLGLAITFRNCLNQLNVTAAYARATASIFMSQDPDGLPALRVFADQLEDIQNNYNYTFSLTSKLAQKDIIKDISVMLRIENVLRNASGDQKVIVEMRTELADAKRNLGVLRSVLSKKEIGNIKGKLQSLGQFIKSKSEDVTEKTETSGLFNGFDDLNGYLRDLDTQFVTVTVGNRQNVERLLSLLDPVVKLSEQLKPLQKSWRALRLDKTTDGVELMQKELDAAALEVDTPFVSIIESIPSVQDCFDDVFLEEKLDIDPWKLAQKELSTFDQQMSVFQNEMGTATVGLFEPRSALVVYKEILKNSSYADAEQFSINNDRKVQLAIYMVHAAFTKLWNKDFSQSVVNSSLGDIEKFETEWMKTSGIEKALKCLKDNANLTSSKFSNVSLAALQTLNSSTINWEPILTASSTLKLPLEDWKKIKTSSSRSVRSVSQLGDARSLSQELSSGVKVIRDLAEVYKKRRAIKKLVDEFDSIDKEVNGLTDPNQKREVENVWTTETKTELKSLVEKIGQLAQTIDESPGKITDFASVFEKFEKFDFPSIDTRKLKSTLSFLKKPPGIQDTLDVIGDLDLQFVRAKRRLQIASGTLPSLMTFLDGYLNITKRVPTTTSFPTVIPIVPANPPAPPPQAPVASALTDTNSDSESSGSWKMLSLFVIVLLVFSVIGNLGLVYVYVYGKKINIGKRSKESKAGKKSSDSGKDKEEKKPSSLEAEMPMQPAFSPISAPDQLASTPSRTALTPTNKAMTPSKMAMIPAASTPPPAAMAQSPAAPNTGMTSASF